MWIILLYYIFKNFALHASAITHDFDYHEIFSRFYDTDGEIFRQNRNLACVIYFGLSPWGRQKTINRRGFYSRKRDIIVNDFDNRRELCGMTAVNRRQMASIDVSSRDESR